MSHRPTAHTRVTERKNEEKSQRRTTIVDAAERLFFKQGFAATTMDAIAHGQQDGTIRRDVAVTETALAMAYTVPRLIRATFPSDTMLRGHLQTSAEAFVTSYFDLLRHALSAGDVAD